MDDWGKSPEPDRCLKNVARTHLTIPALVRGSAAYCVGRQSLVCKQSSRRVPRSAWHIDYRTALGLINQIAARIKTNCAIPAMKKVPKCAGMCFLFRTSEVIDMIAKIKANGK